MKTNTIVLGMTRTAAVCGITLLQGCVTREIVVERPAPAPQPVVVAQTQPVYTPQPAPVYAAPSAPPPAVIVQQPPEVVVAQPIPQPAPVVEVVTVAPGPGFVWIAGEHEWRGNQWVWVGGHWARPIHPHAVWVAGSWQRAPHGWVWRPAHWHG